MVLGYGLRVYGLGHEISVQGLAIRACGVVF